MARRFFIQSAHLKRGGLHRELGYPVGKKLPTGIVNKIAEAKIGTHVMVRGRSRKVTPLLKKRAVLARTLRRLRRRRK